MASVFKKFINLLKESAEEFGEDHATKLSASLAYYTIFSIGPLLLVVITVLGLVYKKPNNTDQVFHQLSGIIGESATKELQGILQNISTQNHSTLFGIIGAVVLVFGATGIFSEIQSSINYIWSIKSKHKRGWLKFILDRLLSFVLVLGLGLVMFVSLIINLVIDLLSGRLQRFLGDADIVLLKGANIALMFVVVTFLFWVIFKVLPDAKVHWKDALVGAAFTGVLFLIGKFLMSYYFAMSTSLNAYGAAASIILLLSWVYYCAMILYFGAEFTEIYAKRWGQGITVSKNAVHIIKKEAAHTTSKFRATEENPQ
ncbi:MAG: ribonuclease [Flavipsychrobacter sp.]|nr:ribonuclease [Flavipsychrobacter sp.]